MTPEQLKASKHYVYNKVQKYGMRIVRLEYDYACNFKCVHCDIRQYQGKSDRRALTIDDVKELARQADELGFAQFVISGGEPLVYPDFDDIVKAIDPQRFYITTDTNGWLLNEARAIHLQEIGVDKIQISIDSLYEDVHDKFRHKRGSWARAMQAIYICRELGFNVIVQTVVDKQRARFNELIDFITYINEEMNTPVCILYAKPVGEWNGRTDLMLDQDDINYVESLSKTHNIFSHLTPNGGCIAVKRMINITKWGDVNPCPVMQEYSLGNIFEEPLKDIISRGMCKFDKHIPICIMAQEEDWHGYIERMNE